MSRKIGNYPIVLVATPSFMEMHLVTQLDDLVQVPWITQNQWNQRSFTLINKEESAKEFQFAVPNGQYQSNAAGLTRLMALEGLGVTICPLWLIEQDIEAGRLVEVFLDYQLPAQDIHLLFLDQKPLPQKVRLAIDWLKAYFRLD